MHHKSSLDRFSERPRMRREQLLLKLGRKRRRFLEQGAGKGFCWGVFKEQVNHKFAFDGDIMQLQLRKPNTKIFFFRDSDPSLCHYSCYGDLCRPCYWLLQQWWLISFCFLSGFSDIWPSHFWNILTWTFYAINVINLMNVMNVINVIML